MHPGVATCLALLDQPSLYQLFLVSNHQMGLQSLFRIYMLSDKNPSYATMDSNPVINCLFARYPN